MSTRKEEFCDVTFEIISIELKNSLSVSIKFAEKSLVISHGDGSKDDIERKLRESTKSQAKSKDERNVDKRRTEVGGCQEKGARTEASSEVDELNSNSRQRRLESVQDVPKVRLTQERSFILGKAVVKEQKKLKP